MAVVGFLFLISFVFRVTHAVGSAIPSATAAGDEYAERAPATRRDFENGRVHLVASQLSTIPSSRCGLVDAELRIFSVRIQGLYKQPVEVFVNPQFKPAPGTDTRKTDEKLPNCDTPHVAMRLRDIDVAYQDPITFEKMTMRLSGASALCFQTLYELAAGRLSCESK